MKYRILGKTGYKVSEIGYGSWSIGSDWGDVSENQAKTTLKKVDEEGINFIDTADIYGDGRSEKLISQFIESSSNPIIVATKIGRRITPHTVETYTKSNIFSFVERSCRNLNTKCLDLLQLHTPPTQIYYMPEIFTFLDELVHKQKIRYYGVSIEKVEEGLKAIEYPNVSTVQIIYNMFRQRPLELFFNEAKKRNIGIIARLPLASGLLTGKFNRLSRFSENDHRKFNRHGEYFDRGETFSGVDFNTGLRAVEELKYIKPEGFSMTQFALRWILMQKAVSTVIAGAKTPEQIIENGSASMMPKLNEITMNKVSEIYRKHIQPQVHFRW
jgi:aryl-alcohol dehydrogenase-like predicted oxidoreductase